MKTFETHIGFKSDQSNSQGEICWGCGHYLIGGGCWKNGDYHRDGWKDVGPNDSCEEWVKEGTKGTITDYPIE